MQYKTTKKIIIDEQKLTILIRLGCPDDRLLSILKTGKFEKTGDELIDEILECLIDKREFKNWGGKRINSGKKKKKLNQVENHLENQDIFQVVDKDKDNNNNINILNINNNKFIKPSLDEVKQYCLERDKGIDAEKWYNHYTSNGWKVGKNPMKDWKAAVRTWEREKNNNKQGKMVLIENGKFYIEYDADDYKDLFIDVVDKQGLANKVWDWIYKKFEYQEVKISFIRSMIEKFKKGI